jgi:hypothetical protein
LAEECSRNNLKNIGLFNLIGLKKSFSRRRNYFVLIKQCLFLPLLIILTKNRLYQMISKEKSRECHSILRSYFQDATNCSFFIFALNELECDGYFCELYVLLLLTFNSRMISFSLLALLYSYIIVSIRLRDEIISISLLLYVYFDFSTFTFEILLIMYNDEDRVKNFLTPLLQVMKEKIFPLLTIIFIIILRSHPNVWIFIESFKKEEVRLKTLGIAFENDEIDRKTISRRSLIVRGQYKINSSFLPVNICIFMYVVHHTISCQSIPHMVTITT